MSNDLLTEERLITYEPIGLFPWSTWNHTRNFNQQPTSRAVILNLHFNNCDQIISPVFCRVDSRLRLHYFAAQHEQVADEFKGYTKDNADAIEQRFY